MIAQTVEQTPTSSDEALTKKSETVGIAGHYELVRRNAKRYRIRMISDVHLQQAQSKSRQTDSRELVQPEPVPRISLKALPVVRTALQEWEGYVTAIKDEAFTARLRDLTNVSNTLLEEAEIPFSELSRVDDQHRIAIGAVFRWVIGYEWSSSRMKTRCSAIVLRDLPKVLKHDLAAAQRKAASLYEWIEKSDDSST